MMSTFASRVIAALVPLAWSPQLVMAGMPGISLTDIARLRLETISFFLLVALLSALVVQVIWNTLRRDFKRLPRLTFGKACGLVTLWGLLFFVVLTMISGARELMTPGAWEKQGLTYQLANSEPPLEQEAVSQDVSQGALNPSQELMQARLAKLERLRQALLIFAQSHGGNFPTTPEELGLPEEDWSVPDASQMKYAYVPALSLDDTEALLYEPQLFGATRFVLRASGDLVLESPSPPPPMPVEEKEAVE